MLLLLLRLPLVLLQLLQLLLVLSQDKLMLFEQLLLEML